MLKKWIPFWAIPVLVAFATGTVWLRLAIVRTTYAINFTEREMDRARQSSELLHLKVAALRSPRRLELLARTKFGLTPPKVDQIIHFKKAELIGRSGHGS
jgi:hypothetical protein